MDNYSNLINKNKYQIFLCSCPASIPINFARHYWFVVNRNGQISRWEVLHKKNLCKSSWGYLHKDIFPPFQGTPVFMSSKMFKPFKKRYWKAKLCGHIEGESDSLAHKMADFIENSMNTYPSCSKYLLLGPNSNTFIQWILNKFPEFGIKLPWNAFGKNYKIRELNLNKSIFPQK